MPKSTHVLEFLSGFDVRRPPRRGDRTCLHAKLRPSTGILCCTMLYREGSTMVHRHFVKLAPHAGILRPEKPISGTNEPTASTGSNL